MRATQTTVTLVVTAAVAAGMLSFLVATPDQGERIAADEVGFALLDTDHVFGAMGHAAEHHRAAHSASVGAQAATLSSRRWLAALPGSGARRATIPANVKTGVGKAAPHRRVAAFVRWADDLPAQRWRVTTSAPVPVAGAERTWTVAAELQVDVAQATTRTRRQVVPLELELRGSVAEVKGAPRSWVVQDVIVGASPGWLRAYRDPVVVGSEIVDVIAPVSARAVAADAADAATATLAPVTTRYASRGRVATLAIWMVDRQSMARAVTRRVVPADVRDAAADAPHALAWADDRGDIVVDLSRFQQTSADARGAAIRHAVAHVATRGVTSRAPAILAEGIALAEARRANRSIVITSDELVSLDAAFTTRTSGIADLLEAAPVTRLDGASQELVAAATVAWLLEARGVPRVQALLDAIERGTPPATALRRTVGLAPRGVEVQVGGWVRSQLPTKVPTALPETAVEETTP